MMTIPVSQTFASERHVPMLFGIRMHRESSPVIFFCTFKSGHKCLPMSKWQQACHEEGNTELPSLQLMYRYLKVNNYFTFKLLNSTNTQILNKGMMEMGRLHNSNKVKSLSHTVKEQTHDKEQTHLFFSAALVQIRCRF